MPKKWRYVVELHLAGHKVASAVTRKTVQDGKITETVEKEAITELSGYAASTVYHILASSEAEGLKQQIMLYYDSEFETLYPQVVDAIRRGLQSEDKYLEAAKVYLKAFGKEGSAGTQAQINVTAEDVVFQILNQEKP